MNWFGLKMVPYADSGETSFPELKYPSLRDEPLRSPYGWLTGKTIDDGAEGLWRIHDGLYDFEDFVQKHPGGQSWLKVTKVSIQMCNNHSNYCIANDSLCFKGVDITEAFETHHMSTAPEKMLEKYFIRKAKTKRNSPFTFESNGFYKTLQRRIGEELKKIPNSEEIVKKSHLISDSLVIAMFLFSIAACRFEPYTLKAIFCFLGGLSMAWAAACGHNYLHQKNNWRMYIFNFCMHSTRFTKLNIFQSFLLCIFRYVLENFVLLTLCRIICTRTRCGTWR
jgi:hypothetical protein